MTWEEAVNELRKNPDNRQAILENYFEEDLTGSAERFYASEEYQAIKSFLQHSPCSILDIGAGRGIASYAFAKDGYQVAALEPDPSNDVGAGAIRLLSEGSRLNIQVHETFGESLPFSDATFEIVYVRQVLHHADDLARFCQEVYRVLKPGGTFIATREHVLSNDQDLKAFLDRHPLHHLYGGEHAYTLRFYLDCIRNSGLRITHVLNPYASPINFAPVSTREMKNRFASKVAGITGKMIATWLINNNLIYHLISYLKARGDHSPGRLYSFISSKPS